jgi:predicted transcriptional regulator
MEVQQVVTKEDMLRAIQELPPEATVEDAVERLYFLAKVDRGIAQAEAGQVVTHDEARRRMAHWLK